MLSNAGWPPTANPVPTTPAETPLRLNYYVASEGSVDPETERRNDNRGAERPYTRKRRPIHHLKACLSVCHSVRWPAMSANLPVCLSARLPVCLTSVCPKA